MGEVHKQLHSNALHRVLSVNLDAFPRLALHAAEQYGYLAGADQIRAAGVNGPVCLIPRSRFAPDYTVAGGNARLLPYPNYDTISCQSEGAGGV